MHRLDHPFLQWCLLAMWPRTASTCPRGRGQGESREIRHRMGPGPGSCAPFFLFLRRKREGQEYPNLRWGRVPCTSHCHLGKVRGFPSVQEKDWRGRILRSANLTLPPLLGFWLHRVAWTSLWTVGSPRPSHSPLLRPWRAEAALPACWMSYSLLQPPFPAAGPADTFHCLS